MVCLQQLAQGLLKTMAMHTALSLHHRLSCCSNQNLELSTAQNMWCSMRKTMPGPLCFSSVHAA